MFRICVLLGVATMSVACDSTGPDQSTDITAPWDRIDGRIAVAANYLDNLTFAIDVIDADLESVVRVVASNDHLNPAGLSWSPTGDSLAFGAQGGWAQEACPGCRPYQVFTASAADGSGMRNINPDPDGRNSNPSWGSDGRIAWLSGDGLYLRIDAHAYLVGPTQFGSSPGWSTDGSTLLVSVRDETSQGALHRFDPADSSLVPVLQSTGGFSDEIFMSPKYSPDGTRIVYSRWGPAVAESGSEVWIMAADGSQRTRITHGHDDQEPCWSPDGNQIAFIRDGEPHVMSADGSAIEQLLGIRAGAIAWTATVPRR